MGTIKFSEKNKIVLVVEESVEKVREQLQALAHSLNTNIVAYTTENG